MKVEDEKSDSKSKNKNILLSLLFGGCAGCVAKTVIAPLDRTKINFQSTDQKFSFIATIKFLTNTYKTNGFLYLWRGNTATLSRVFPYAAVQYTSHGIYKVLLNVDKYGLNVEEKQVLINTKVLLNFICGSMAGMTSVFCTYPLDLARARLAVTHKNKYRNLIHVLSSIKKEEGFRAFYRGINPTIIGIIPYSGMGFLVYESIKDFIITHKTRKMTTGESLLAGGVAGLLGQFCCYPLDIVRRKMQTGNVTGHPEYTHNVWKTLSIIWNTEGLKGGLYKGFSLNLIKTPTATGISFTVYHSLLDWSHLKMFVVV